MEKMIVTEYGRPIMMQKVGIYTENHVSCRRKSDPLCSVRTA